jgi:hypothetical protein
MTTRSPLRVWMGRVLRGTTALALAVAAVVVASASGAAAPSGGDRHGGIEALLDDDPGGSPPAATATPRPETRVSGCPQPALVARGAARDHRHDSAASDAAADCAHPAPPRPAPSAPRSAVPVPPAGSVVPPRTAVAVTTTPVAPLPLPIPPPIWLTPTLAPVPLSYGAELAPTSVLVLGFGSVALASTVMTLRLLRRGR